MFYGCEVLSRRGGFFSKHADTSSVYWCISAFSLYVITVDMWDNWRSVCSESVSKKCTPTFYTLQISLMLTSSPYGDILNCDQLWYFFVSRNHRVYPICREEAVRLLRSTRMARAYSEGAYSADFDYERYWNALPLHLCIRHIVVSSSCPSSVFNLSVNVRVMTENDILSDIGFC